MVIDMLYESFEMQNWAEAQEILFNNSLPGTEDLIVDVFEDFLFRIENVDSKDAIIDDTVNQICKKFLLYRDLYHQIIPHFPDGHHIQNSTVMHNLCIENKHTALAMLLRNLDPKVAAREVRRVAFIQLDYTYENKMKRETIYKNFNANVSTIQAAWCSNMFDRENKGQFETINDIHDLTDEMQNLWKTTVYLLLAFDCKPIDLGYATNSNWNILDAIHRFGHRIDEEVILLALKLYPKLSWKFSSTGKLPLHEAAKIQITYQHERQKHCTEVDRNIDICAGCPVNHCTCQSFCGLIKINPAAASTHDRDGKLPIHLCLQHCRRNQDDFLEMKDQEQDSSSLDDYTLQSFNMIKALVKANPTALHCVEPFTKLCPFLQATSHNSAPLDICFYLLLSDPTILQNLTDLARVHATECSSDVLLSKFVTRTQTRTEPRRNSRVKRVVSPLLWTSRKVQKFN